MAYYSQNYAGILGSGLHIALMRLHSCSICPAVHVHTFYAICLYAGMVVETEGHDRSDINLPGSQLQLLQDATNSVTSEHLM